MIHRINLMALRIRVETKDLRVVLYLANSADNWSMVTTRVEDFLGVTGGSPVVGGLLEKAANLPAAHVAGVCTLTAFAFIDKVNLKVSRKSRKLC